MAKTLPMAGPSCLLWSVPRADQGVDKLLPGKPGGGIQYTISRWSGAIRFLAGKDMWNDCTAASQPCMSISHAIQGAEVGDYIHVAGGTYTDSTYDDKLTFGVTATVIITRQISFVLGGVFTRFLNPGYRDL